MRVAVMLSDLGACGNYRMIWPAQAVQQVRPDWNITYHKPNDVSFYTDNARGGQLAHVGGIPKFEEMDLIVIQRVGKPVVVDMIRMAQNAGCAVVLDNDDAMWAIDRQNIAWPAWNNPRSFHWKWTDKAAEHADLCTNTTHALARRYGGRAGRFAVVPNFLPTMALDCALPAYELERDRPTVGWSGQLRTHPRDPAVVGDAVRRAAEETGCRVLTQPDAEQVSEIWKTPVERVDPVPLGVPYYSALRVLDVALVPLEDNLFNRAKSSLKALEAAAAGSAVVASPTPANRELSQDLPILLASSPAEWHDHIVRLLNDPEERRQRGEQAREVVRAHWTYETQGEQWAATWERAIQRRQRLNPRELADA